MNLLVIDQDSTGTDRLAQRLHGTGFRPLIVKSANEAMASPLRDSAAALLIDQGHEAPPVPQLIAPLRRGGLHQPLLVLSARDDWRERVASFDVGADDFLVKPVHSEEIHARLRAVIRRAIGASTDRIVSGDLHVDLKGQCAWLGDRCLELTRNEFRLLRLFILAANGLVRKEDIAGAVWPGRTDTPHNAIEVLVGRLRAKLGCHSIGTIRGFGYRLTMAAEKAAPAERAEIDLASRGPLQTCR